MTALEIASLFRRLARIVERQPALLHELATTHAPHVNGMALSADSR